MKILEEAVESDRLFLSSPVRPDGFWTQTDDRNSDKESKSRLYTYLRLYKYSRHAFFLLFWIFTNIWCILSTQKQRIEVVSRRESAWEQAIVDHDELAKIRSRPAGPVPSLLWSICFSLQTQYQDNQPKCSQYYLKWTWKNLRVEVK
jgi:hypothetical protein